MSDPSNRFKVSMNAKQYNLTGCSIKYTNMNIVCVQGGPKSQKQYKKLMLRRIDWSGKKKRGEDDDQDDNQHQVGQQGQLQQSEWCMICWEGVIEKPNFKFFVDKEFFTEAEALEFLNSKGVGSYWDTAKSYVQA